MGMVMIKIVGARGNIQNIDSFLQKIQSFSQKKQVYIQVFNADLIFGKNHIISAVKHAKRSIENKTNTTNSFEMEILLYASGERQLKLAIPKMGIKEENAKIVFTFVKEKGAITDDLIIEILELLYLKRDDNIIEGDEDTLKRFGINKTELETVSKDKYEDLILEKVAMVDIIK